MIHQLKMEPSIIAARINFQGVLLRAELDELAMRQRVALQYGKPVASLDDTLAIIDRHKQAVDALVNGLDP